MSYYVTRANPTKGRPSWVGPIRSAKQAERDAAAWIEAGYPAAVVESTPDVRRAVRAWERAKVAR